MSDGSKESTKDIFTKLTHSEERDRLFQDLVKIRGELKCKAPNSEEMIRLEAHRRDTSFLICTLVPNTYVPGELPQSVVCTFTVGVERYFMTTPMNSSLPGFFALSLKADVFQLQRRQSYRIRIPDSYNSSVQIKTVNGKEVVCKGTVQDLSTGGFRAFLKSDQPAIQSDDILEGILMIGARPMFPFKARARHIRVDQKKQSHQVLGIEFVEMTNAMESKIFSLTMELHRELFSRWTDR